MENLQLVLFVLGAIAIIAVLVHGFWSIRKQQPKSIKNSAITGLNKEESPSRDSQGFDVDGIGQVRVFKKEQSLDEEALTEAVNFNSVENESHFSLSDQPKQKMNRQRQEPVLSAQDSEDLNQMELGLGQEAVLAQSVQFDGESAVLEAESLVETATPKSTPTYATPVTEPRIKTAIKPQAKIEPEVVEQETLVEPRDVLVLHVVAAEGQELNGAELLPSLLTLNFKFGDMNIFHRHLDNAGTGKVLFSLANMVKPGIFNPDEMEQFSTEGVVLFMTLPCHGDPLMNFSIMLNSAQQLADDLGGQVLDGGRDAWSETTKQSYLQRIRAQIS
ncbi:cell division protein ZipA [Shewanella violacea]|uniref:Cell division protein ZipA n=1 Tax=Shewanella violacea (strain JCM 10179 / CIP 106290 / LMG 19151 / DSS12) TaxID=637905 RepID=D4ZIY4_SHEVD|nr:cell division protein ZipA [Shewanella violacea]BAJ01633.1 cell division protein ZipA [Shewanella violacea DSS12]